MITFDKHLIGPWVFSKVGKVWGPEGREAIGILRDGMPIGGAVFEDYSGASITIHFAIESPRTPLRVLLVACAGYAYNQMKVKKVLAPVPSTNKKSINFVMKIGFKPEAIIEEAVPDGDMLIFSLRKADCGFIPNVKEAA